jgi:hypothetical protein
MGGDAREFVVRRFNRAEQAASFCTLLTECTNEAVA